MECRGFMLNLWTFLKNPVMKFYYTYPSPVGRLAIAADAEGRITDVAFDEIPAGAVEKETEAITHAFNQLNEYFAGKRKHFDLTLNPAGTEFQRKVWDALCRIPYGQTRTYGQIAVAVGNAKGSRAVGMANNRNPIAIVIPCHRVIGAGGKLTGYAGGLDKKELLLALEKKNA